MCKSDHFQELPKLSNVQIPQQQQQTTQQQLQFLQDVVDDSGWPTASEVLSELKQLASIACPMVVTGLLVYLRSMISMLFLGHLGDLELAGGSLAIGFANITGYSVLSGLAMGMEPICGQAFGARRSKLLGLTLQRTILFLLVACLPIVVLWLKMSSILTAAGQDASVTAVAHTYLLFSLPDLAITAFLAPLRIYLRTQKLTLAISIAAAAALTLHVPINLLLVSHLQLGIRGVAMSAALTNFNLLTCLVAYVTWTGVYRDTWPGISRECLRGWRPLVTLALPSAASVCLEWWWYELMIIFSGLLVNARAAVATMGVLIQTTALVYIFPSSLSQATSTRVGNELGADRPRGARVAALVSMFCAGALGLAAMSFTIGMRHVWGSLFTRDSAILQLVAAAMPVVGVCEIGNCPQTTGCGVLRGTARPSLGANINLGSFYLVGMPVALLLAFGLGVGFVGLWFGLFAAQASCLVLMLLAISKTDWQQQAQRAQELTGGVCNDTSSSDDVSSSPSSTLSSEGGSPRFELGSSSSSDDEDEERDLECGKLSSKTGGEDKVPLVSIKVHSILDDV